MSAPPDTPDAKCQTKNHRKESGTAQAKKTAVASERAEYWEQVRAALA